MYTNANSAVIGKGARFFACSLTDENSGKTYELNVKEPKLRTYKEFMKIQKTSSLDDIIALVADILKSNKENVDITTEFVENSFTSTEILSFFEDFAAWLSATRSNDPN
jgi:hypothetical protein